MKMTKFTVGKRYSWTAYTYGGPRYDGILETITSDRMGHFLTRNNELWAIPLNAPNLKPFKRSKKNDRH